MSHFTVLVVGNCPEDQLAPYQENNMGDCPQEYLEFNDEEEECLEEYKTKTWTKVVMPDGRLLNHWDEEFRVEGSIGTGSSTHRVPDHLEQREVPFTELYSTFEEFMEDYHGRENRDDKTGKYGYWENPNAKWDWYQLGGRWTGMFKLKEGSEGLAGFPGLMTSVCDKGYADQALLKDIDIEGMRQEAYDRAYDQYSQIEDIFGGEIPKLDYTWSEVTDMKDLTDWDSRRNFYSSQPAIKKRDKLSHKLGDPFFRLEDYQISKEEYANNAKLNALLTHAVVRKGKWYEKGEMGWWAIVTNEKDNWLEEFNMLIDGLDENTLMSVYDCHI